ncbi:hypothetical protein CDIK_0504 [Cucumispora dikerogammari]|nr:hypothetical protein CDIK_0504 [Cucumispora dikerogammari]
MDDPRFSGTTAGTAKVGETVSLERGGNEYCKIKNTKRVKPGKHGAAKVIITGVNIMTGKCIEWQFTQSTTLYKVASTQETYLLLHIDVETKEIHYQKPNDPSDYKVMSFSQIAVGLDDLILKEGELGENDELTFILCEYPSFSILKDIRSKKAE